MQGEIEMSRKKSFTTDNSIEILNEPNEDDMEICGFTEAADISRTPIVSFNFRQDTDILNAKAIEEPAPVMSETKASFENKPVISDKLIDNRTLQSQPNGITPPVDGEYFEIKRTFIFRRSTLRMLNQLKAAHPDENAYLSSIVDTALQHYYKYIFNEGGKQL